MEFRNTKLALEPHITPESEVVEFGCATREMTRIAKPGGVLAFAYVPGTGAAMHAMCNRWGRKELPWRKRKYGALYPNRKGNEAVFAGVNDDDNPFYFTMPEEMEAIAEQCNLAVLQNAGVDIALNAEQINHMDDEQYACWLEFAEYMLKFPSCAGLANHALMICRKEPE